MKTKLEDSPLNREVTSRDVILGLVSTLSFFGVLSMVLSVTGSSLVVGTLIQQGNGNSPNVITHPGGGGGPCASSASMEFTITNNTPWYCFFYVVHSTETAYFNVTNLYVNPDIVASPGVSIYANVGGFPGGQVLNTNGPYHFVNGTNSNGVQYEIFSGDVEMVNQAIVYNQIMNNMYTNILVDYEIMGNGSILIKYYVDYNNTLSAEQAAFITITDLLKSYSASGGG